MEKKKQTKTTTSNDGVSLIAPLQVLVLHVLLGLGLALAQCLPRQSHCSNPPYLGAVINALGAIVLGAPIGIQYFMKTANWSIMMSAFTFTPAASAYGSLWNDWLQIFAHTQPRGIIGYVICIPAHGAVIGAWLGAWPMPLDWDSPWQEWPVCVSYGAIAGYLVGILTSFAFALFQKRLKGD